MSRINKEALKNILARVTHEVPTGPHTDVRKRKINPSFKKKLQAVRVKKYTDRKP